jgi:hypothetical protein
MLGTGHVVGTCSIDFSFSFLLPPIILATPQETQESIEITSPGYISSTLDLADNHLFA